MSWTTSKTWTAAAVLAGLAMGSPLADAQAIPVTDREVATKLDSVSAQIESNAQTVSDAVKAAGTQVSASVANQNELLGNINDVLARVLTGLEKSRMMVEQKRQNAMLYDSSMGAKARPSCAVYRAAASRRVGDQGRASVERQFNQLSKLHHERNIYLDPGAPVATSNAVRVLDQMQMVRAIEEADPTSETLNIFSTASVGAGPGTGDEYTALITKMHNIANPNPIALEEGYDAPNQPAATARKNAKKVVAVQRQQMVSEILNSYAADRTAVYDTGWIRDFVTQSGGAGEQVIGGQVIDSLGEQTSKLTAMGILNKHRLNDENWILHTTAKSNEIGLQRDSNLMAAQDLSLQHDIYIELRKTNMILIYLYALMLEQNRTPAES